MLQPVESFYPEIADIWIEDMRYPELAELTSMNLFQHLPYISEKVFQWMAGEGEYFQLCGYMSLARLLMKGMEMNDRAADEFLDQALTALQDQSPKIRRASYTALQKYAYQQPSQAKKLAKMLQTFHETDNMDILALKEDVKLQIESLH